MLFAIRAHSLNKGQVARLSVINMFPCLTLVKSKGRCPNGFLGLSLNDKTILFFMIVLIQTVSVG